MSRQSMFAARIHAVAAAARTRISKGAVFGMMLAALVLLPANTGAQVPITAVPATVDFTGYTGSGFQPTPAAGQLDSDDWAATGWTDGSLAFGGTQTTGDYARGPVTGPVVTAGFFALDDGGNSRFLLQPGGGDWAPGTMTLRLVNSTGFTLTSLGVSYQLFVRNDQGRSNSFNFSHSTDGVSFTPEASADYASPIAADALGLQQVANPSLTITGLEFAPGDLVYLRWAGTDVAGSGSRDEFALDQVQVTAGDHAPAAVNDPATAGEDSGANAIDVLANDTDQDGGTKTIASATDPANGTVALTGGSAGAHTGLTYTPDANYCNDPGAAPEDTFDYTLNGGSTATVSVTVTCVDDPPSVVDDAATVTEDSGATAIDVLANDTDPDAGPKSVQSVSDPADGTVVITGGGTGLSYTPDANYCNDPGAAPEDTFTYTLNAGSTATVSMTVTCVDEPAPPSLAPPLLPPATGPTGLRAAALKKCKKKKSKKARKKCKKRALKLPV